MRPSRPRISAVRYEEPKDAPTALLQYDMTNLRTPRLRVILLRKIVGAKQTHWAAAPLHQLVSKPSTITVACTRSRASAPMKEDECPPFQKPRSLRNGRYSSFRHSRGLPCCWTDAVETAKSRGHNQQEKPYYHVHRASELTHCHDKTL